MIWTWFGALCGPASSGWALLAAPLLLGVAGLPWLWLRERWSGSPLDMNRLREVEASLRERDAIYRLLAEHAGDMIVRAKADRTRDYVSPACRSLLGYDPEELLARDFADYVHPEDRRRVETTYQAFTRAAGRTVCSYRLRRRDGSYVWVESTWVTRPSETMPGEHEVIAVVRDVSERKEAEARISFLARHDALTGLANRALFREQAEQILAERRDGELAAVLCLDLDTFKTINDTLGHAAGDTLLAAIASRFSDCIREGDTFARLGGDEFAILMAGIETPEQAAALARKVIGVASVPITLEGREVAVGISVGIAIAPTDGSFYEELVRRADTALYRAKSDGRNTFRFFEEGMDARRLLRQQQELELRTALAEGRFQLVYQPLVSLRHGHVTGFEALLRWNSSNGPVPPGEFIPIAEETGMIVAIGAWVLDEACRHAAQWPAPVTIAVNLSPVQLRSPGLVATVRAALEDSGLAAVRLELEITESVLLEDNDGAIATLYALHELGVRIAMDDFGTGYSSLRYLRSFPFDKIKLDQSFVADLLREEGTVAIVRAVAGLGRSLGIVTLAEGVESRHQLDCLRAEGYAEAQGFFFSRPAEFEEATALLGRIGHRPAALEYAP